MTRLWAFIIAAAMLGLANPAKAQTAQFSDLACESTTTSGTGDTMDLDGNITNWLSFEDAGIVSGRKVPYKLTSADGKNETGWGIFTNAAPDTLTRGTYADPDGSSGPEWSTDGQGTAISLTGITRVCIGPITSLFTEGAAFTSDTSPQLGGDLDLLGQTIFDSTMTDEATLFAVENGFRVAGANNIDSPAFWVLSSGDGSDGPGLNFWHDSASPADGDVAGQINVLAGADDEVVGSILLELDDGSTGSEDTHWDFVVRNAGADLTALTLGGFATTPGNYDAGATFDFGAHTGDDIYPALWLDGAFRGSAGDRFGPTIIVSQDNATGDGEESYPGQYESFFRDSGGTMEMAGYWTFYVDDDTDASEDAAFYLYTKSAGVHDQTRIAIDSSATTLSSPHTSDGTNFGLFDGGIFDFSYSKDGADAIYYAISRNQDDGVATDGDDIINLVFQGQDSAGNFGNVYASLFAEKMDATDGTEDGRLELRVLAAGSADERLILTPGNFIADFAAEANPVLQLQTTNAGADGPEITFFHNSATPADGDTMDITMYGGADDERIGSIIFEIDDGGTGSEDTQWQFVTRVAGSDLTALTLGGSTFGTYAHLFQMGSNNDPTFLVRNTSTGTDGPEITIYQDSADPAANDEVGVWSVVGEDSAGNAQQYSRITTNIIDATSTNEDARMEFVLPVAGAQATRMSIADGVIIGSGTTFPGAGNVQALGFYANDNTGTLFSANNVLPQIQIAGTGQGSSSFGASRYNATAGNGPSLLLAKSKGATVGSYTLVDDGSLLGRVMFEGADGTDFATGAEIRGEVDGSPGAGDMPSRIEFGTSADASESPTTRMTIKADGGVIIGSGTTSPGNGGEVRLYSAADAVDGTKLEAHHDDPSADANDFPFTLEVFGGADDEEIASLALKIADPATTTEDTVWEHVVRINGADSTVLAVAPTATFGDGAEFFFQAGGSLGINDRNVVAFYETEANGDNFKGFQPTAAITSDTTCGFEDDANFIPDSCVGDGSDASDGRIKTNLRPAHDVGALLDSIKIYDYEWTVDAPEASEAVRKGKPGFGPVAQELFGVNSDWVDVGGEDPITEPWTWKPEKLVPYLIAEVQNLRKRVKELEEMSR